MNNQSKNSENVHILKLDLERVYNINLFYLYFIEKLIRDEKYFCQINN